MGDPNAPPKKQVRVTILNQSYTLLAPGDPRETEEIAQSVDDLLQSISSKATAADSTRVAVLGCLHLADRLRALERDLAGLKERVTRKSEAFAQLLNRAIDE